MRTVTRVCIAFLFAACAAGGTATRVLEVPRGVAGFDTRDYPGDDAMRRWRDASPYRWVGYYLPAPCYTGTTWTGRRAALHAMGWGFAVLYVGEQDWANMGVRAARDSAVVENPRCTRANLTPAQGIANAGAAAAAAAADGFPDNTIIFLDVERVERVTPELSAYVRSWARALLEQGRYLPGLYAHDHNAPELYTIFAEEFLRQQRTDRPRLWVAKPAGFTLERAPAESGYAVAAVWQGVLNTHETWDNLTFRIDVNVADSDDPSRGR